MKAVRLAALKAAHLVEKRAVVKAVSMAVPWAVQTVDLKTHRNLRHFEDLLFPQNMRGKPRRTCCLKRDCRYQQHTRGKRSPRGSSLLGKRA